MVFYRTHLKGKIRFLWFLIKVFRTLYQFNLCVCRKEVVLPAFICGVAVSCAVLLEGLFVLNATLR